jgi:hypothetical protein
MHLGGRRIEQIFCWTDRIAAFSMMAGLISLPLSFFWWAFGGDNTYILWSTCGFLASAMTTLPVLIISNEILKKLSLTSNQGVNWKRDGF